MRVCSLFPIILITLFIWSLLSEAIVVPPGGTYENVRTYRNSYPSGRDVESQVLISAVPCLTRFLRQNLPAPDRVPLMIPASHISHNTHFFLKELQLKMPIFVLQEKFNSSDNYQGNANVLLLLDDISLMENITSDLVHLCSQKCVYVAIVTKFYEDVDDFMENADSLVHLFWERKIANVAIVSPVGDSIQLAKSLSFKSNELREPSTPEFFGSCEETSGWEKEKDKIFSPLTLNGSIVKVALFLDDPFTIIYNGSEIIVGIEGDLLNAVSDSLTLQLIGDEIPWTSETDDLEEIRDKLESNQSFDMVIGGLQWAPTYDISYTFPYQVVKMVWLIPVAPNISLRGLIAPFQNNVWYAVGLVLILSVIIKLLILHDITFLDVFALVIGTATSEQPEKLSGRIQYLSWAIFGYILSQSYLASLAGVLIEESHQQIETMEELISTGIQYGGTKRLRELFAATDVEDDSDTDDLSDSDVIQEIYNNFVVLKHEEYEQHLQDLISGKNKNMALVAMLNDSTGQMNFDESKVHSLKEPLATFPIAFAVWKGLPFLDEINRKIMLLIEGGFIGYWKRRYITDFYDPLEDEESEGNLGLIQLIPGFVLLAIGIFASTVAFVAEIMIVSYRKRKVIKERVKVIASIWVKKAKRNRRKREKAKGKINKYNKVKISPVWDYYPQKKKVKFSLQS